MTYKVFATNQPALELEVDEGEFIDLQRAGLLVPGKGDIGDDGKLKPKIAKEAPPQVTAATPVVTSTPAIGA